MPAPDARADTSVRLAMPGDATAVSDVQVRAWQRAYSGLLPADVLAALDREAFEAQWEASISRPAQARQRVLVALERVRIRGFAALAPATDADAHPGYDAEVVEFVVDPAAEGAGHGSRLLHAVVDTLRADRFTRATLWLNATDDRLRAFLADAGWAPDGAYRELDLRGDGAVVVKQVRLHTDIRADGDDA